MVKDARSNRRLVLLVLASFTAFLFAVVLRIGIGATPYETTDSAGRPMGFNDPLHAEHYLIMLRNFNPVEFFKPEYAYEWILFAAHILGAWILLSCGPVCTRLARWFFVGQAVLFPLSFPALFLLPSLASGFVTGRMDREAFVDIPFILAIAQPVWLVASLSVAFALRGTGLGVTRLCAAFVQATCAGAKTFAKAMHYDL